VFSRDFRVASPKLKVAGTWQSSAQRARASRGVRGHAPLENFKEIWPGDAIWGILRPIRTGKIEVSFGQFVSCFCGKVHNQGESYLRAMHMIIYFCKLLLKNANACYIDSRVFIYKLSSHILLYYYVFVHKEIILSSLNE